MRFGDMPPHDFELFIAQMFRDMGYDIEQVLHGADYGIDIVAHREGKRTGVQVKRYQEGNNVGVQALNQAVGGRDFHACDQVVFVTTSDYTQSARELASATHVILWNWDALQRRISDTYLNGLPYHEYFAAELQQGESRSPLAGRLIRLETSGMKGGYTGLLVYVALSNESVKNVRVAIAQANYITIERHQYSMRHHLTGYFDSGIVYAGCTVEACVVFDLAQIVTPRTGDKILIDTCTEAGEKATHALTVVEADLHGVVQEQAAPCFIATAAYHGNAMAPEVVLLSTLVRKFGDVFH